MFRCATARINYVGKENELVLNTTVKSGKDLGLLFAPTWDLVMSSKRGIINWEEYTFGYKEIIRGRYKKDNQPFLDLLNEERLVVFTCYCKDTCDSTRHCHRYIIVDIMFKIAMAKYIPFQYLGELR